MKFTSTSGLLALAAIANAFPTEMYDKIAEDPQLQARAEEIMEKRQLLGTPSADDARPLFEPVPIWNKQRQYVSNKGAHRFVPPGPNDARGPCPGLNAMANHGYLPHDGYATISEFIDAVMSVAGMGPGLAAFLAVYGAAIDGSGTAWSIGGTPFKQGQAGGNGIANSHNKYEGDASPLRPDLYQYGNAYKVRIAQYQQLSNLGSEYSMDVLTKFRSQRFDESVQQNPLFFNGPFTGVLVQPAAYTFIYRFMANHTRARPEGVLNHKVFEDWFSITGSSGSYKWTPGHEKIPDNWYRRPTIYSYDQAYFLADVANAAKIYPKFLNIGGNTGKKDSFTGVQVEDLSGGAFNLQTLLNGNNFACFAYQFAANAKPDIAQNNGLLKLTQRTDKILGRFACPQLTNRDVSQLKQFPGYTRSGSPFG